MWYHAGHASSSRHTQDRLGARGGVGVGVTLAVAVSVPSFLTALPQPLLWKLGASQGPSSLRG